MEDLVHDILVMLKKELDHILVMLSFCYLYLIDDICFHNSSLKNSYLQNVDPS